MTVDELRADYKTVLQVVESRANNSAYDINCLLMMARFIMTGIMFICEKVNDINEKTPQSG